MPNVQAPFGFRQTSGTGALPTYEQVTQAGGINYNQTPIFNCDPIQRVSGADSSFVQAVAGVNPIAGIFAGCKYMSTAAKKTTWANYWPGGDVLQANQPLTEAYYTNDPLAQFIAQVGCSGAGTPLATPAMIGLNAQFALGTGNPANGLSGAYIDLTTAPAVTATLPFRITGLITFPPGAQGTAANGNYNYVIVAFNNVETKSLTAF